MQKTIYKLTCKNSEISDVYIGQTKDIRERYWHHRSDCENPKSFKYNFNVYKFIRENGGFGNWEMVSLATIVCESEIDARQMELDFCNEYAATLNTQRPLRTRKQWLTDNKDRIKEQKREYYQKIKSLQQNKQKCSPEKQPSNPQN